MTSYGYVIIVIVHSCITWFHLDCTMQLKLSHYFATNVCSRKSATTFGDLPDWLGEVRAKRDTGQNGALGISAKVCKMWICYCHDDVIKWKNISRYWPFVMGIHQAPVNSRHKGQWRRALVFSLICSRTNDWANHRDAGDLRRHHAHYDASVMCHRDFRHRPMWRDTSRSNL